MSPRRWKKPKKMTSLASKIIAESFTKAQALSRLSKEQNREEEKAFVKKTGKIKDVDIGKIIDEAQKEIGKVETLVIYCAFELPDETVEDLGRKARGMFQKDIFIEIKVDPDLIGGAALVWKGQYKDYSLRAKFEQQKDILRGAYEQFIEDRRGRICPER